MNGAQFQRLASLFDAATAGEDWSRDGDVESLMSFDRSPPRFLSDDGVAEFVLVRVCLERSRDEVADRIPGEIAGYPVLGVLGSGGWGVVYQARQLHPVRDVALKVLRRGPPGDDAMRRFRFEAEALAALNHPGIAQIYDAGTWSDEGTERPYLAMELVHGPPLTRFGRERGLSVTQRLHLFLDLCDAVQHAHQNGVIHRDLKPGNILVAPDGRPKIVDFGIARGSRAELDLSLQQTRPGEFLGTLPYMSPEQFTSTRAPADTRTDVYALGVILFEFLTGELPFDLEGHGIADAARIICERPPRRLRDAAPVLAADLETIVDKVIDRDPKRRYQTAQELAADVRRFLENRPIEARPASVAYRLRKFAGRNRALSMAIVATVVVGFSAAIGMSVLAVAARRSEQRAERRFDEARQLARAFLFDTFDRLADVEGSLETRRFVVATGLGYLDAQSAETTGDPTLILELAAGYVRLGDVQGNRSHAGNLGDAKGAAESYAKAERLLEGVPASAQRDALAASLLESRAALVGNMDDPRAALKDTERAVTLREGLASRPGAGPAERCALHAALELRVAVARYFTMPSGGPPAPDDFKYAEACERAADAYGATLDPVERTDPWRFAHITNNPGSSLRRGTPAAGRGTGPPIEEARASVESRKREALAQPRSAAAQTAYFESLMLLGRMLIMTQDADAAGVYAEAARIADAKRGRDPQDADACVMAHEAHAGRSEALLAHGRHEEALAEARVAHGLAMSAADERRRCRALSLVVSALARLDRMEEARRSVRDLFDACAALGPMIAASAGELAALVLRAGSDDASACAEAGRLCEQALRAIDQRIQGRPVPPPVASLRQQLEAVREACAQGDRETAARLAHTGWTLH